MLKRIPNLDSGHFGVSKHRNVRLGSSIIPIHDCQAEWPSETHQRHPGAIITAVSLEEPSN
jgi:hypothetical protein